MHVRLEIRYSFSRQRAVIILIFVTIYLFILSFEVTAGIEPKSQSLTINLI